MKSIWAWSAMFCSGPEGGFRGRFSSLATSSRWGGKELKVEMVGNRSIVLDDVRSDAEQRRGLGHGSRRRGARSAHSQARWRPSSPGCGERDGSGPQLVRPSRAGRDDLQAVRLAGRSRLGPAGVPRFSELQTVVVGGTVAADRGRRRRVSATPCRFRPSPPRPKRLVGHLTTGVDKVIGLRRLPLSTAST